MAEMCLHGYVSKTHFTEAIKWKSLIFCTKDTNIDAFPTNLSNHSGTLLTPTTPHRGLLFLFHTRANSWVNSWNERVLFLIFFPNFLANKHCRYRFCSRHRLGPLPTIPPLTRARPVPVWTGLLRSVLFPHICAAKPNMNQATSRWPWKCWLSLSCHSKRPSLSFIHSFIFKSALHSTAPHSWVIQHR